MQDQSPASALLQPLLGIYLTIGFGYGELQAWRDMGCVALVNPAAHFYAIWYSVSWPFYVFGSDPDPAIRGNVVGFGVVSNPNETYVTEGCQRFSADDLSWNSTNLSPDRRDEGLVIRVGRQGMTQLLVLEFVSQADCERQFRKFADEYASNRSTSFDRYLDLAGAL